MRRQRVKPPLFPPLPLRRDKPTRPQPYLRRKLRPKTANEPPRTEGPREERPVQPVTSVKEFLRPPTPEIREAIQPNLDAVEELDAFLDIEFD